MIGVDARGRKQYRYHQDWRAVRDEAKYERVMSFARALPRIRGRVESDMKLAELPKEKVLATVVKLLEVSLIRIGNDEYARTNKSFGLTTMHNRHRTTEKTGRLDHFLKDLGSEDPKESKRGGQTEGDRGRQANRVSSGQVACQDRIVFQGAVEIGSRRLELSEIAQSASIFLIS